MTSIPRKIAIMGYRSVGKSSLSIQFVEGQFVDSYDPTIENTFVKTTKVNNQEYELKLVDTAGQDEYSILPSQLSIHGYVLVYNIASPKSFEIIQIIYDKLLDMTGKVHIPVVLVGNKKDLHMDRVVTQEEGRKLADSWKAGFLEASAKQNECVADIFHTMLMEIEKANRKNDDKIKIDKCSIS
ncbi:GTP-binding protein Rheb homolog [Metopolophium dirhodum]|uniref:GTP-binding protein Rheb homolog n=1 Tax=Metopolophium dirhodum TaxID=44670 RepID=UPI00298F6130|nr:GTP-binding protein Rheb homolog [Metopolophium dirhodum]